MDYQEADKALYTKRGVRRSSVRVGHNTWLRDRGHFRIDYASESEPNAIALRLYDTDVITFTPSGLVMYDSNGWRTNTTLNRMNRGPFRVYTTGGIWMVGDAGRYTDGRWRAGASVEFSDGITLDTATGTVVSGHYRGEQAIRANRMAIENEQVVPRIDGYVRRLEVAASAHEWDCVDCIDGGARDHLIEHLDGRFYPAALLRHATPQWRSLPPRQLRQALHEYLTDRLTLRAPLYAAA
jgi:hypothetical protein